MQLQLDIFGDQPTVLGHTTRIVARSSDRIAWLRARSQGVTATDAARLSTSHAVIAVALSIGSFYLFALWLGIVLPPGILRGIL